MLSTLPPAFASQTMKSLFVFCVICVCKISLVTAQHQKVSIAPNLSEKIYLQLDSKIYTSDKTIWFKAIVTNSATHIPSDFSKVLYVELIDPNERILQKKILKLKDGTGEGFFDLN